MLDEILFLNALTVQRKLNYSSQNVDEMSMWTAHFHILNSSVSCFLEGRMVESRCYFPILAVGILYISFKEMH